MCVHRFCLYIERHLSRCCVYVVRGGGRIESHCVCLWEYASLSLVELCNFSLHYWIQLKTADWSYHVSYDGEVCFQIMVRPFPTVSFPFIHPLVELSGIRTLEKFIVFLFWFVSVTLAKTQHAILWIYIFIALICSHHLFLSFLFKKRLIIWKFLWKK